MFNKLKQIKDLKSQAKAMQDELANETATGSALSEKIKITLDGNQEIKNISIDESLLDPSQKDELEQGIQAAFTSASKEAKKILAKKFQSGDLNMPDLENLS